MHFNVMGVSEVNPSRIQVGQWWTLENDMVTAGR